MLVVDDLGKQNSRKSGAFMWLGSKCTCMYLVVKLKLTCTHVAYVAITLLYRGVLDLSMFSQCCFFQAEVILLANPLSWSAYYNAKHHIIHIHMYKLCKKIPWYYSARHTGFFEQLAAILTHTISDLRRCHGGLGFLCCTGACSCRDSLILTVAVLFMFPLVLGLVLCAVELSSTLNMG